jgi:hypothetical protein
LLSRLGVFSPLVHLATRRGVYANFSQPSGALGINAAVSLPGLWSMPSFMRKQAKSASRVQVEIIKKQLFPARGRQTHVV